MKSISARIGALIPALLLFGGAPSVLSAPPKPMSVSEAPWRFNFDIYGWLPNAPATIKIDGHEVANIPESFDNILDSLEMAAMLRFNLHKGRLGFQVSSIYYDGDYSENFFGLLGERRKFDLKETVWLVDYSLSYQVARWDIGAEPGAGIITLEPYAGFRFLHDKIRINVDPGLLDQGVNVRKTISTNGPILGLRANWWFTPDVVFRVEGDYGGFNVDDMDTTYQAIGALGYHFNWGKQKSHVYAGYRYTHLELKDDPIDVKVDVRGPFVGIGFEF